MSTTGIIWKDAIQNASMEELGKPFEIFNDCQHLIVDKRLDKRVTLMFKKTVAGKDMVSTVITSKTVNQLYREKKLTKGQLFSLPVLRSRIKGADEDTMWLSLPAQGWQETITAEPVDYNALATL